MENVPLELDDAEDMMREALVATFIAGYLVLLARLRRDLSYASLAATSAAATFLFLVTVKWWFWPWYLTWLVPMAAITPRRSIAKLAILFSLTAILLYAAYYWRVYGDWHTTQRLVFKTVFVAPLAFAALLVVKTIVDAARRWAASAGRFVTVSPRLPR